MNKNLKTGLIVGGIVFAVLIVIPLVIGGLSGWQNTRWGMMGPWMMGGSGWGWFMPLVMILFWGLIIWGIIALIRGLSNQKHCETPTTDSALEILKRRYAQGDITKKEYEQKKKDLV
jgi:putative membrane protein